MILRYEAASSMLFRIFPRNLDCRVSGTTDAATFSETFWCEDCSIIMGLEESVAGFVFQQAIIASSKIVGQPSFSVITLA